MSADDPKSKESDRSEDPGCMDISNIDHLSEYVSLSNHNLFSILFFFFYYMGAKADPRGLRIGIMQKWASEWYVTSQAQ